MLGALMKYTLNKDCFLVESKKARAIYNIHGYKIVELNPKQFAFMKSMNDKIENRQKDPSKNISSHDLWIIGEDREIIYRTNHRGAHSANDKFKKYFRQESLPIKELFIRLGDHDELNCYFCSKDHLHNRKPSKRLFGGDRKRHPLDQKEGCGSLKQKKSLHISDIEPSSRPKKILDQLVYQKNIKSIHIYTDEV